MQAVIEGDATRKEVAEALTAGQIEAAERIQGITEVAAAKRLVAGMQVDAAMTIQAGIEGREARLFAIEEATPRIQMIVLIGAKMRGLRTVLDRSTSRATFLRNYAILARLRGLYGRDPRFLMLGCCLSIFCTIGRR